jgi:hypothetical protein
MYRVALRTAAALLNVEPCGGEVALDGNGDTSPFAAAFMKHLETPGLEVRRLFDLVRDDIMDATANHQQPFVYGSVSGRQDFYFVEK